MIIEQKTWAGGLYLKRGAVSIFLYFFVKIKKEGKNVEQSKNSIIFGEKVQFSFGNGADNVIGNEHKPDG